MSPQGPQLFAVVGIPELDCFVVASRGQASAVGGEGQRADAARVACQLAGVRVPRGLRGAPQVNTMAVSIRPGESLEIRRNDTEGGNNFFI